MTTDTMVNILTSHDGLDHWQALQTSDARDMVHCANLGKNQIKACNYWDLR
jgi:hypothetical protein